MYKCTNCSWEGEELSDQLKGAMHSGKCPRCGDEVKSLNDEKPKEIKPNTTQSKIKLDDMTKDELNDFAAKSYPNLEIKYWWSKKRILNEIKDHEKGE